MVSSYLTNLLFKYAEETGINLAEIGEIFPVTAKLLKDLTTQIPVEHSVSIWDEIQRRSGDPHFGLHFGESIHRLSIGHPLNTVLMNCATVQCALERATCYQGFVTNLVRTSLHRKGEYAHRVIEPTQAEVPIDRHHIEASMASLVVTLRLLTQNKVHFTRVCFTHPQPDDISEHERIFGCALCFQQPQNELVFPREILNWPVQLANPQFLKRLEPVAQAMLGELYEPNIWKTRVVEQIRKKLRQGEKPTLQGIARDFSLGPRQLQNKLQGEATTFQDLLDEQRKQAALQYLCDGAFSLNEIACLLGFSGQSAFNHAFKRWTGFSPTEYRQRNLIPA
jgi:AraC-like DNA-binding protein